MELYSWEVACLLREEDTTGDLKWSFTAFGHNLQIDRVPLVYKLEKTENAFYISHYYKT